MTGSDASSRPDLTQGIALDDLADGAMIEGHVGDAAVLLVRRGDELFAVGAQCPHYGGPLAEGLLVGDTIRCPWHHAAFCLRTGAMERAPALDGLPCWRVERRDGRAVVVDARPAAVPPALKATGLPASVVIVGGGAAAIAAAVTLRQEGYPHAITLLSADADPPYDRPNLSKDYLAGTAQADWLPLRAPSFYAEQRIDVRCNTRVTRIDPAQRSVELADGGRVDYGALLLATGTEPNKLNVPGADLPHVCTLRSRADCDALIGKLKTARRCVVVGASFIGLEAAAALRTRGLDVHVVAPDPHPMGRVLGDALGDTIKALHEAHGVVFHLGATPARIGPDSVTLSSGDVLPADVVLVGIGVHPNVELAQDAGLAVERGVTVDRFLQTSAPGIYAAGDIARWPDPLTGQRIRVEHWVVAERQGIVAARNLLGQQRPFDAVPFFWSQHYDLTLRYVGHAEQWDRVEIDGDLGAHDCSIAYWRGNTRLAVVTIARDLDNLKAEAALERQMTPA
ncbi:MULTISPECIES: FAD-dependent oxidoreductase [Burkholderia]|uniref:Pyridine nucleotide-disulfide oxidoreductase n=3 Tax=Burkholderia cenocepacia TaxID=95486 RepID=A0A1V2VQV1_9BURK|nr:MULTISPECIES: FAD-dependent oxidoreductase [Burkholderia]MDP9546485.1 NADPH-dependent 2,4-dienoyl-CoA reductase/sulfur reductase-like enzyme/nitrite reductase/ring-hydroxylating ferredoxin subunit [Burkholderia cepacia]MBR8250036.1 FAD-dependent oxidoreductase [Burkholderia cenocepacia]MBR8285802.1 FAD-dependent oxidoreductase [Burkholderia cenocepacia]MBR8390159.1 FAD-dependent oxidoreductase [Burkholderia cenocepacia]MBR8433811.1 FAD-dependent oxidoreductase [Burkholderia cenocepacia]